MWKTLTSLAIWGPGWGGGERAWFTSTLSFILIYMPNIEYDKKPFELGPYIKSRGIRGTEMSANAVFITMETYVQ